MNQYAYALIGLTALVAALVGLLTFAALRFGTAVRDMRKQLHAEGGERAFMAAALQEAVTKLRVQERAMAARAEASERLSGQIVSSLTAGLLVVGLDGEVRSLNPAGHRLLGLPEGASVGHFRELLARAAPLGAVIDECLAKAQPIVRRALQMPQPASVATHLGVTVSPLFNERNELQGAICLFSDLTAVVDLEEQVRLKDSLSRLGELTAGLAHEFRNGLATIHGYSRLIEPEKLPPAYRPYLAGIREETDSLGRIVTNFLTFARPVQLTLTPVALRLVAERAVDEISTEVQARGGEVGLEGEFPIVDGDEVLLRQVFQNLLRNALEACAAGPSPVPPRIVIEGQVDYAQRQARIAVNDNGPGIDPAARERIFRPFVTSKGDGTGLGLALVQKIIVTHNGRITAGAAPGGGASLQIVLPLPPAP